MVNDQAFYNVIFEPWALGDALIAASFLDFLPSNYLIVCSPKWEKVLCSTFPQHLHRFAYVDLPYTGKNRRNFFDLGSSKLCKMDPSGAARVSRVFSIRGDIRDYYASIKLFPKGKRVFRGWVTFLRLHYMFLDAFFTFILKRKVKSRYESWAQLLGIDFFSYFEKTQAPQWKFRKGLRVSVHMGSQWRSKQYPFVSDLKKEFEKKGCVVELIKGPGDLAPEDLKNININELIDDKLVAHLKTQDLLISNDSGVAHLAHCLRLPVVTLNLMTNPSVWAPPHALALGKSLSPQGYSPRAHYNTDICQQGWLRAEDIVSELEAL